MDPTQSGVHPEDGAVLDALFENGFGGAAGRTAGSEGDAQVLAVGSRASRVARLLALLDGIRFNDNERESLVQATMARVSLERHRERAGRGTHADRGADVQVSLIPDDEDALETLVSAEFELSRVPSALRDRAARQMQLLGLLDAPVPLNGMEALVNATMARVQASVDASEGRMALTGAGATSERGGLGGFMSFVRSREIVSVAAMLLIATALLTPLAQYAREYSRRAACSSNMQAAGVAFGQYAGSNQDHLPLASASRPGNLFWNTGKQRDQSNSANLFVLRVQHYASVEQLACAGQVSDTCRSLGDEAWDWPELKQVSVSFQNMFARERPTWSQNNTSVVLTDASPVIRRAVRGEVIFPFENSANHNRRGQNALMSDGQVQWLKSPVLGNNDNIWLPRPIEDIIAKMTKPHGADPLDGTESPSAADDAFVGP